MAYVKPLYKRTNVWIGIGMIMIGFFGPIIWSIGWPEAYALAMKDFIFVINGTKINIIVSLIPVGCIAIIAHKLQQWGIGQAIVGAIGGFFTRVFGGSSNATPPANKKGVQK